MVSYLDLSILNYTRWSLCSENLTRIKNARAFLNQAIVVIKIHATNISKCFCVEIIIGSRRNVVVAVQEFRLHLCLWTQTFGSNGCTHFAFAFKLTISNLLLRTLKMRCESLAWIMISCNVPSTLWQIVYNYSN